GFIALGSSAGDRGMTAVSTDGLDWTSSAPGGGGDAASFGDLFWMGDRAVAVGRTSHGLGMWTSTDGLHWSDEVELPGSAGSGLTAATSGSDLLVLGGPGSHADTLWILPGVAPAVG